MGCRSLNSVGGPGEAEPWAGRFLKIFLKLLEIANQPISPKFKPCPSRIGSSSSGGGGIFFLAFSNIFQRSYFNSFFYNVDHSGKRRRRRYSESEEYDTDSDTDRQVL